MSTVLSILAALVLLCVLIVAHELGHFSVGRLLGFEILEFSVGLGPKVCKVEKNGIIYSLRALPIGGMCRFYGESEPEFDRDALNFSAQKVWKRFLVVLAGPAMNILLALVLGMVTLLLFGDYMPQLKTPPLPDQPAALAGLQEGDIIWAVNGKEIAYYGEVTDRIKAMPGDTGTITVLRDGKKRTLSITDFYNAEKGSNYLGVTIGAVRVRFDPGQAIGRSVNFVISIMKDLFQTLGKLFTTGVHRGDLAGPVGTISYIGEAVRMGWESVLRMCILLSINLGIINLLPIPGLDGGRLLFLLVEGVRRKAIPPEKEGMVHLAGLALVLLLVLLLTCQDIVNLIGG